MVILILSALAILCLYEAIDHAINNYYHYKYAANIVNLLKDSDTRRLFVYLRPYLEEYIDDLRKNTETYAKSHRYYRRLVNAVIDEKTNDVKK